MSFGGASNRESEQPVKDRHAMLNEWRRQSRIRDHASAIDGAEDAMPKRSRTVGPPLPPALDSGETPLERIRRRKAEKERLRAEASASTSFDEGYGDSSGISGQSLMISGTPGRLGAQNRRLSVSRPPPRSSRWSTLSTESENTLTQGSALSQPTFPVTTQASQLSQGDSVVSAPARAAGVDSVEDAVVQQLQQRIRDLEKHKMDLSMEIAPLKARLIQKESTYEKEQNKLLQEIEELQQTNQLANERNRDLEMQFEKLKESCNQLRSEVRKASSTLTGTVATSSSGWNRQLQNDRDVLDLKDRLKSAQDEIDSVRLAKVSVEKELHGTKIELDSLYRSYDELQADYEAVSQSTSNNQEAELKLEHLTTEHIATSAQLNAVCADLAATKARAEAEIQAKETEHKKEVDLLQFQMSVLKTRAADSVEHSTDVDPGNENDAAVLKARLEERDRRIAEMENQLQKGEAMRRKMHNKIQELRGNIRVYVRTRPFLPSDGDSVDSPIDVMPDGESLSIVDNRTSAPHPFKFDKVFPPSAGQDAVFDEVSDFVQSALDGYHVCLFSYGQTGSGKTHTMQGSGIGAMRGIIPRAVEQILQQAQELQRQNWTFRLSASFLEIYNENFKDLLISMSENKSLAQNPPKLAIKRSREGKSFVENLSEVPIETVDKLVGMQQLEALMGTAARSRSVARTKMNAQSSRSHSVFMLHLRGCNEDTGAVVNGALNLCDLAGSERLDRSGASDDARRLKETQAINKSLSCLGDVFNALSTRAKHVPYRNSKLTYLLQDCLSGDGKALMFVNLSPTALSSNESLCSLRFAQRVNQVELGKPTKHIEYNR